MPGPDALLDELADVLRHRGPDERELFRSGPVGLAFPRLSLVNLEYGTQSLVSDDGNLVLIANGGSGPDRTARCSCTPTAGTGWISFVTCAECSRSPCTAGSTDS